MRITASPHAQRGRVLGWLLLVILAVAAGWGIRTFFPEMLPGVLRPPRPTPEQEKAAAAAPEPQTAGGRQAPNPPLYKWKDDNGQWHVTDSPPRGRSYETVRPNPDTNVVPAFVPPVVETDESQEEEEEFD